MFVTYWLKDSTLHLACQSYLVDFITTIICFYYNFYVVYLITLYLKTLFNPIYSWLKYVLFCNSCWSFHMELFSQKWALVSFLGPLKSAIEFSAASWPSHVTIAGTFAADFGRTTMRSALEITLAQQKQLLLKPSTISRLGPKAHKVTVQLFEHSHYLQTFHEDIVALLRNFNIRFNNPDYVGTGFIAQQTIQELLERVENNIQINTIALVEMYPHKDPYRRKIIMIIPFG